jgi:sulfite reductase (NADPH) hemoprotein beta-component
MAAMDDSRTLGRTRLSFADEAEIDEFVATLERFERGELSPDQWRAFRLVRGTYGQRQPGDVQMLRVKVPQGVATALQLRALADVAEQYSRGFGHITTRENVQFHFVKLHDVEPAMRRLAEAGLTTREACGNSVRNITACPYAGVALDEVFDVTPYAEALTRHLLRHPMSSTLPRKFKIAFEGCRENHAVTPINDIGWRARVRGRVDAVERGFAVTVGGGTSILCTSGRALYDFLPASEILEVAEAIVRVFHRLGDREHKQRNRMKFLIKALGWERWRSEFEQALADIRADGGVPLPFDPDRPPIEAAPDWPRPPAAPVTEARKQAIPVMNGAYASWLQTNVRPQKQPGHVVVAVTLPLGDVTGAQLRVLADLALACGDGAVRFTQEQDLVFRWVSRDDVAELYRRLAAAGLGLEHANTIADVTSCPGADSCRLAVTQSRGLGRVLGDHLRARPALVATAPDLKIKISGCPNGCGQHHIAGLGFQGSVRKLGDKAVPQYFVMVGGAVDDAGARFGRLAAKIPVRRLPEALDRLLALYVAQRSADERATAFFQRVELARVKAALTDLERLTPEDAVPADFVDFDEEAEFKPEVMDGECAV